MGDPRVGGKASILKNGKEENYVKRTLKRTITAIMAVVVTALSVITAFAVQYDNNNITYSYSETGDCTVVVGDTYYVSNDYIEHCI